MPLRENTTNKKLNYFAFEELVCYCKECGKVVGWFLHGDENGIYCFNCVGSSFSLLEKQNA